jgi:hypothetical protein
MSLEKKYKKIIQLSDDALKFADLANQLALCSNDLILLTLKGHLVIENLLKMNLVRLLAVESLPNKQGRLNFKQKLKLVEAVVCTREPGPNADLFCAIDKLNDIRNQLAHNLKNQGQIVNDVKTFINEYHAKAGMRLSSDKSLSLRLKGCILKLCEFLHRVRVHFYKLEQREND